MKLKLLSDILYKTRLEEIIGSTNLAISSVTFDSRKVKKDSLFIATRGTIKKKSKSQLSASKPSIQPRTIKKPRGGGGRVFHIHCILR